MSEDAYKGDAQFTVSVDGKQLAGTFTTTASHAAGASQSFTFKGDWALGAHTVAVNFLNDAYGGTAATDRNLYVNAVSYDGTNTDQSAALMSTGPKSFSVTDATAIPSPVTGSGSDTLVLERFGGRLPGQRAVHRRGRRQAARRHIHRDGAARLRRQPELHLQG